MGLESAYRSEDSRPRTKRSVVAYCDMLGFSERVRQAARLGRADELLGDLKEQLGRWYEINRDDRGYDRRRFWELKAFTDNVVLGIPIQRDATRPALAQLTMSVECIQRGLALDGGYFLRGGVAVGDLYVDDEIVYGEGLLDAYAKEQDAVSPRVVLHESARIEAELEHRSTRHHGPLGGRVLRDEDEEYFVSYLAGVWESEDEPPELEWLERHAEAVSRALQQFRGSPRVLAKYVWVARYHNYVCGLVPDASRYELGVPRLDASTLV